MAANDLSRRKSERDVLSYGEVLEQGEMLEHHANAERARLGWTTKHDLLPHPTQFTRARLDETVHHLDQSGFARTILAKQRMDFGWEQVEVDGIIGEKITVPLADGNGAQERRRPQHGGVRRHLKHGNLA